MSFARVVSGSFVFACVVVVAACAGGPAKDGGAGALAGCRLMPGPVALCDDGKVLVDVAHIAVAGAADRIVAVHETTDRPDDDFQLAPGTPTTTSDGVTRVDAVHPWHQTATVGTVTFFAPAAGDVVVSCANFSGKDAGCAARTKQLLATTVPPASTFQHRPTLTLADDGCTGTDEPLALQRLCPGGEKLSVVGINGRFGPAAAWWTFHRVVQSLSTSVRAFSTCNVLGQASPCGIVEANGKPALFGLAVEESELRLAACFFPGETTAGLPAGCVSAFPQTGPNPALRLIGTVDVPFVGGCTLTQPDEDSFARAIACDDGSGVAQFAAASSPSWSSPPTSAAVSVSCTVRGAPGHCQRAVNDGVTQWRAAVDDPRVDAFVCSSATSTPPAVCAGFIDVDAP